MATTNRTPLVQYPLNIVSRLRPQNPSKAYTGNVSVSGLVSSSSSQATQGSVFLGPSLIVRQWRVQLVKPAHGRSLRP